MEYSMEKIDFAIVVLHYQTLEMTKLCIWALQNTFIDKNFKIVLVDNASPNQTGKELINLYKDCKNIKVLLSSENLGFANGNNLGYRFVQENYDTDFVAVINNDLLITQRDFFTKASEIYKEQPYWVLGPDIYSLKANIHQNPTRISELTLPQLEDIKRTTKFIIKHYNLYVLRQILGKLKSKILKKKINLQNDLYQNSQVNPVLQGACYVYSKDFMKKRNNAFNPETFMYFEEEILAHEVIDAGGKLIYSPLLNCIHLEDVSSDSVFGKGKKQEIWKHKNMLKSMEVLYNQLSE